MVTPALEDVQRAVGDHYEVLDLAGTGGMGAVFRARHRSLGHLVAVKVLPPEIAPSALLQERFRREAALAAHLSHPNIVPVYEFDTREGITFLIMPYVRGTTLESVLSGRRERTLQPFEIRRVLHEVGAALHFAHQRGVVHRDVKPSNILIEEDSGRALLTDFGVAHVQRSLATTLTVPGQAIGTPDYMAPEQLVGLDAIDGRADLYSLSLIAFEALTGTRPSLGTDRQTLARALRAAQPELSARLATALVAPLAERPADRPASVDEWLALLDGAWTRPRVRLVALAVAVPVLAGVAWLVAGQFGKRPAEPRSLAVMPFVVLGSPPYPATQLAEWLVSRFSPVPGLSAALSFRSVAAQAGTSPLSNSDAEAIARQLQATYYLQASVDYSSERNVTLTATLYEVGRAKERGSGSATGPVGSESEIMDQAWGQILGRSFAPNRYVTIPSGKEAIAAYFNAEDAFRRGAYKSALEEYDHVIAADSSFAIAYFRRALVVAQVDPTEEHLTQALAGAQRHQTGLSPADSLLLEGYRFIIQQGDGLAAVDRFKRATEKARDYPQAWFVLGEFYYHFGNLFDQTIAEADRAFNSVLDLDPRFAPAIAHLISLSYLLRDDKSETQRLIHEYLKVDSTSVVAEAVGIADTLLFQPLPVRGKLLKNVGRHSFTALEYLAFQAAEFGTKEQREGLARDILRALEQRAATDAEQALALRFGVAADLAAGWPDSARARLRRAGSAATARERDRWILVAQATRLPSLGDVASTAARVSAEVAARGDSDAVAHWLLARLGRDPARHAAALDRLAATGSPLPRSLSRDLKAQQALSRGDTTAALTLWDTATKRYAVLSVGFDLVASLWPLRLDMARVASLRGDDQRAERACGTFATLMGYVDQVAWPEIERLCARWRPPQA